MAERLTPNFPRPSRALIALMVTIACLWVMFAMGVNWGGGGTSLFDLLAGDSTGIFKGQVWRLLTASLMHSPTSLTHPLFAVLLLYFFVPSLEERWGTKRVYLFLFGSAAFAFFIESLTYMLLPSVAKQTWYGAMVMADAALVAWAFSNRDQVIYFMFVLPLKPLVMVGLMLALQVLLLIIRQSGPEGMVAPFAAALAGWLFCDSGPGRRAYLRFKLRRLQGQVQGMAQKRARKRRAAPHLKVIRGGAEDDDDKMLH